MRGYFLRRFLLIPPTLLGVTLIVFAITRFVPGGPMDKLMMQASSVDVGGSGGGMGSEMALSKEAIADWAKLYGFDKPWYLAYVDWLGQIVRGDLGRSYRYQEPVWDLITQRLHISTYFGLLTLIITYAVTIPLGILKAIKHRTYVDNATSIVIFTGYAVPGYVLGALLLVYLSAQAEWFPMGGFTSMQFPDMTPWEKFKDILHHTALPLICYLIHDFAFMTMIMKNNLMDNLAADYVRTAVAKGVSFKDAVRKHALRNSLIPIATSLGQRVTLFVAGSFLIEMIFDIDGIGLLGFESLLERDYPVVIGIITVTAILVLLGNILADFLVALVDPRVRFN